MMIFFLHVCCHGVRRAECPLCPPVLSEMVSVPVYLLLESPLHTQEPLLETPGTNKQNISGAVDLF